MQYKYVYIYSIFGIFVYITEYPVSLTWICMRDLSHSGGAVYELGEVPDCDVPAEVSEDVALCIHIYHSK